MRIVTANELQDWLSQGELLEKDSHGPKVVRLPDGSLLKIFRSRRNPLLARLRPDARRFLIVGSGTQAYWLARSLRHLSPLAEVTIWGRNPDLPTRTLDMHISRIRTKLDLRPQNGFRLAPVYSYGYRLERLTDGWVDEESTQ